MMHTERPMPVPACLRTDAQCEGYLASVRAACRRIVDADPNDRPDWRELAAAASDALEYRMEVDHRERFRACDGWRPLAMAFITTGYRAVYAAMESQKRAAEHGADLYSIQGWVKARTLAASFLRDAASDAERA